jgi:hypothetical protein
MLWLDHIKGKIIATGASNKINVSAVSDNQGGAIITWQDDRAGNMDIYAQWISEDGDVEKGWPADGRMICNDLSDQSAPKMVRDEDGGAFVTWSDNRGGDYDIFVRQIHSNGVLDGFINGKRLQLEAESKNQVNPAICTDGNHGAIIAYEQYTGPGDYDIFAQRINNLSANMWDDGGVPACIAANNQKNPSLINDATGSAIIVWEDNVNFTWDIFAQRVANNTIQWTANGVAIMAIALDQIHPVIVQAGEFSAIIVWEHYLSGTDSNIYAQKISGETTGTLQWLATGIPVSTTHPSLQRNPQAVADGFGGVIVVYETEENYADNGWDIYGQRINQHGAYAISGQPGGYVICTWDTDQTLPMLTYSISAEDNAIYAWRDKRNENDQPGIWDIYTLGVIEEEPLPMELSSFTATTTVQNFVKLTWVTETETGLAGYRMYRNDVIDQATAVSITPVMIPATNTSTTRTYTLTDTDVILGNTYYYWLESIDMDHTSFHGPISVFVSGEVPPVLPEYTTMNNAYPNPFRINSNTTIDVTVKAGEQGDVTIYNILGQVVNTFKVKEGITSITWNGIDSKGNTCGSGMYFYKLNTPSTNLTKKMIIVK